MGELGCPGLNRKQRSLLNIGILMALNRGPELTAHIRGAINNGLTEEEISEAIRHTMIYVGVPSGVDAFKVAGKLIREMKERGEYKPATKRDSDCKLWEPGICARQGPRSNEQRRF